MYLQAKTHRNPFNCQILMPKLHYLVHTYVKVILNLDYRSDISTMFILFIDFASYMTPTFAF
jgi:hypothetical protein